MRCREEGTSTPPDAAEMCRWPYRPLPSHPYALFEDFVVGYSLADHLLGFEEVKKLANLTTGGRSGQSNSQIVRRCRESANSQLQQDDLSGLESHFHGRLGHRRSFLQCFIPNQEDNDLRRRSSEGAIFPNRWKSLSLGPRIADGFHIRGSELTRRDRLRRSFSFLVPARCFSVHFAGAVHRDRAMKCRSIPRSSSRTGSYFSYPPMFS